LETVCESPVSERGGAEEASEDSTATVRRTSSHRPDNADGTLSTDCPFCGVIGLLIVAIGDSITYGFPYSPAYSWVAKAAAKCNADILNQGICGETTTEMLARFEQDVVYRRPGIVIIMGGTNDAFAGIGEAEVEQNIRLMAELAAQHSIRPIIGLPIPCCPPREENLLAAYRQRIAFFCERSAITMIDFYTPMLDAAGRISREMQIDGVHPNEAGYRVMANAAITVLEAVI